jgi:hypothetical protein
MGQWIFYRPLNRLCMPIIELDIFKNTRQVWRRPRTESNLHNFGCQMRPSADVHRSVTER